MWGTRVKTTCGACSVILNAAQKTHRKTTKSKKFQKKNNKVHNKKNNNKKATELRLVKLDAAVEDEALISGEIEEMPK